MNKKFVFILLFFVNSVFAEDAYFQYKYQEGFVTVYHNDEKIALPQDNFLVAESSEAKSVDLNGDGIPEVMLKIHNNTKNTPIIIFLSYDEKKNTLKEIKADKILNNVTVLGGGYIVSAFTDLHRYEELYQYNESMKNFNRLFRDKKTDENVFRQYPNGTTSLLDNNRDILKRQPVVGVIEKKTYLYNASRVKNITGMYLVKGDRVTILNEIWDKEDQKWYFVSYKGKNTIYKWLKSSDVKVSSNLSADVYNE